MPLWTSGDGRLTILAMMDAPAEVPPLKACGVLVVRTGAGGANDVREVLLMRHADRWDVPKGHVDPGETDETVTALRELEEETGIPPDAVELDPRFRFEIQYPVVSRRTGGIPKLKTLVIFLGRLLRDVPVRVSEHEGFEWREWPCGAIQTRTIDPLLAMLEAHLAAATGDDSA